MLRILGARHAREGGGRGRLGRGTCRKPPPQNNHGMTYSYHAFLDRRWAHCICQSRCFFSELRNWQLLHLALLACIPDQTILHARVHRTYKSVCSQVESVCHTTLTACCLHARLAASGMYIWGAVLGGVAGEAFLGGLDYCCRQAQQCGEAACFEVLVLSKGVGESCFHSKGHASDR